MTAPFTIHEVAAGVWAAVAPDLAGPAVSNAAIVDMGGKTLVVDTFMTIAAAEALATEARRLTGRPPQLVVNSHWHRDHVRGNQVFADALIVGTRRMNELIVADAPNAAEEGHQVTLPDLLIDEHLDVEGERPVAIATHGRGHTEVDLFVHVPDQGVLIAGDLVWNGIHPKTDDGYPAEWAAVVDRLVGLGASAVIPGHGPPGGPGELAAMAAYLRELDGLVAAVRAGDLVAEHAEPPSGTGGWDGADRYRRGLRSLAGASR